MSKHESIIQKLLHEQTLLITKQHHKHTQNKRKHGLIHKKTLIIQAKNDEKIQMLKIHLLVLRRGKTHCKTLTLYKICMTIQSTKIEIKTDMIPSYQHGIKEVLAIKTKG
jgi:hypothetical protein